MVFYSILKSIVLAEQCIPLEELIYSLEQSVYKYYKG